MSGAGFMMASGGPAYISNEVNGGNLAPTLFIGEPAGAAVDDLIVAIMGAKAAAVTWTPASGYTERLDQGASPSLGVSTQSYVAGADTWTASSSAPTNLTGIQLCFRGGQYDAIGTVATISADGTLSVPGATAVGGLVVVAVIIDDSAAVTVSTPAGYDVVSNANTTGQRVAIFKKYAPPGVMANADCTISGLAGGTAGSVMVAVK